MGKRNEKCLVILATGKVSFFPSFSVDKEKSQKLIVMWLVDRTADEVDQLRLLN